MTRDTKFPVGAVLANDYGQYTKVISVKNGIYGLSGWMPNRPSAEKSNVAQVFLNVYGLTYANARVVSKPGKGGKTETVEAPKTAPVAPTVAKSAGGKSAAKSSAKKTAKKTATKKVAKKTAKK